MREKLLSLGLTQKQLATRFGVSQACISLWMSGKRKMGGSAIKLLESLLAPKLQFDQYEQELKRATKD